MTISGDNPVSAFTGNGVTLLSLSRMEQVLARSLEPPPPPVVLSDFRFRISDGVLVVDNGWVFGPAYQVADSLYAENTVLADSGHTTGFVYFELAVTQPIDPPLGSFGGSDSAEIPPGLGYDSYGFTSSAATSYSSVGLPGPATPYLVFYPEEQDPSPDYFRRLLGIVQSDGETAITSFQQVHFGDIIVPTGYQFSVGLHSVGAL